MYAWSLVLSMVRRRRRAPELLGLGAASLAVLGCYKTPSPPDVCRLMRFPDVAVDWQHRQAVRLTGSLDSLRAAMVQVPNDKARIHLIQEYLLVANRLGKGARDTALASIEEALARRPRP